MKCRCRLSTTTTRQYCIRRAGRSSAAEMLGSRPVCVSDSPAIFSGLHDVSNSSITLFTMATRNPRRAPSGVRAPTQDDEPPAHGRCSSPPIRLHTANAVALKRFSYSCRRLNLKMRRSSRSLHFLNYGSSDVSEDYSSFIHYILFWRGKKWSQCCKASNLPLVASRGRRLWL